MKILRNPCLLLCAVLMAGCGNGVSVGYGLNGLQLPSTTRAGDRVERLNTAHAYSTDTVSQQASAPDQQAVTGAIVAIVVLIALVALADDKSACTGSACGD